MIAARGTLRRDAVLLLAAGIGTRLCGFVFIMILSRTLSERAIGIFSFAEAVADTFILIASFNLDSLIVRRIAGGPPSEATARFAPLLGFRIVSAPIYLLTIIILSHYFRSDNRWVLPIVGACTLLESLFFCVSDLFVGVSQPAYRAGIEVVAEVSFTACFVAAMYLHPTLGTLLAVSILRGVFLMAGVLYLVRKRLGRLSVGWDNRLILEGTPFLLMTFLTILQGKVETILLGVLRDYQAVADFQLALRLFAAALFIPQAISSAVFPRFAATGLDEQNRGRLLRGLAGLTGIGLVGALVLLCWPAPGARLIYGPMADKVIPILRSMSPLLLVRFLTLFLATALAALRRERRVLLALTAGTATGLIADALLIPRWGSVGASFGLLVSAITQLLLLCWTLAEMLSASQRGLNADLKLHRELLINC